MKQPKLTGLGPCLVLSGVVLGCGNVDDGDPVSTEQQALWGDVLGPHTDLYAPPMQEGAREQVQRLKRHGQRAKAKRIEEMATTPQAVWLEQGSPHVVKRQVKDVMRRAKSKREVPVFVAYNIPFRDCAQFSAGGATTVAEYQAWVEGVARGIGRSRAVVILEPDSLGIIPWFPNEWSGAYEWCQPAEADAATAATERLGMLNWAIDRLNDLPNVRIYLDGTHSSWLGVAEMTNRLTQGGVQGASGFFLNASNYRATSDLQTYGRWVSSCLALEQNIEWWDPLWCPGQYREVEPGVYAPDFSPEHVAAVDAQYADLLTTNTPEPLVPSTSFVIDTSRNGQGAVDAARRSPAG